jgi:transglutaminase-like putative cysteine protease
MIYHVTHTTTYQYSEAVSLCQNLAHLTPRPGPRQTSRDFSLDITPLPAVLANRLDYFGNPEVFFSVQEPHRLLSITTTHMAEVMRMTPPDPAQTAPWEDVRQQLVRDHSPESLEAYEFVFDSHHIQASSDLAEYALPSFTPGRPVLEAALDLTRRIHTDFRYDRRATTISTSLQEVFAHRRGVCQDFAHLQIGCLRSLGLAARYVSGYISTRPPPGQKRLVGADASHAWVSVYCLGAGWVDLDPTNDQIPSDHHILLAWGRDYDDVSPIKGVILGGGTPKVVVSVDVAPEPD